MDNYLKWQKCFIYACMLMFTGVLIYGCISMFLTVHKTLWIIQSSLGIILLALPLLINRYSKIKISFYAYLCYAIIIMLTIFVGYIFKLYEIITWYDIVTHSLSHVLLALLGIVLINRVFNLKGNANPFFIILFGIAFALACGFVWELIEFSLDSIFGLNMQRFIPESTALYNGGNSFSALNGTESEIANYFKYPSGYRFALIDTMFDLIVDLVGAVIGGILFAVLKNHKKSALYNSITLNSNDNKIIDTYDNV